MLTGIDLAVLLLVAAGAVLAVRNIRKEGKRGGCAGCSGCCDQCPGHRQEGEEERP